MQQRSIPSLFFFVTVVSIHLLFLNPSQHRYIYKLLSFLLDTSACFPNKLGPCGISESDISPTILCNEVSVIIALSSNMKKMPSLAHKEEAIQLIILPNIYFYDRGRTANIRLPFAAKKSLSLPASLPLLHAQL
jgi:hypothetical protein